MIRFLAVTAIVLNIGSMGAWFYLNPPATYERLADRDLRLAHDAFRKVSAEQSYSLYHRVAENYSHSTFADEGRFFAARTAFLGLGKFDEAEKELEAFLASKSKDEDHRKEAQEFLSLIRVRTDIPAEARDMVLWEYVQAYVEEGNGKYSEAATRLEWISEAYGTTALGKKAGELALKVAADLKSSG